MVSILSLLVISWLSGYAGYYLYRRGFSLGGFIKRERRGFSLGGFIKREKAFSRFCYKEDGYLAVFLHILSWVCLPIQLVALIYLIIDTITILVKTEGITW